MVRSFVAAVLAVLVLALPSAAADHAWKGWGGCVQYTDSAVDRWIDARGWTVSVLLNTDTSSASLGSARLTIRQCTEDGNTDSCVAVDKFPDGSTLANGEMGSLAANSSVQGLQMSGFLMLDWTTAATSPQTPKVLVCRIVRWN